MSKQESEFLLRLDYKEAQDFLTLHSFGYDLKATLTFVQKKTGRSNYFKVKPKYLALYNAWVASTNGDATSPQRETMQESAKVDSLIMKQRDKESTNGGSTNNRDGKSGIAWLWESPIVITPKRQPIQQELNQEGEEITPPNPAVTAPSLPKRDLVAEWKVKVATTAEEDAAFFASLERGASRYIGEEYPF